MVQHTPDRRNCFEDLPRRLVHSQDLVVDPDISRSVRRSAQTQALLRVLIQHDIIYPTGQGRADLPFLDLARRHARDRFLCQPGRTALGPATDTVTVRLDITAAMRTERMNTTRSPSTGLPLTPVPHRRIVPHVG